MQAVYAQAQRSCNKAIDGGGLRLNLFGPTTQIREVTLTDSGKIQITFNTMPETLYYCPGANGEASQRGTVLTFVRSFVKAKPKVDYPAKRKGDPAKTWDKLILVDAKDRPIFVKSGKDLLKIFPADNSAAVGAIHAERIATLEASLNRAQELYSQGNVSRDVVSDAMIELGEREWRPLPIRMIERRRCRTC